MTKKEKQDIFNNWQVGKLNQAKDILYEVSEYLNANGLTKDSDTLTKMIYKIETFQNKYKEV